MNRMTSKKPQGIARRLLWAWLKTILLVSALWTGTLSYFLHKTDSAILERKTARQTLMLIYQAQSAKYEFLQDFLIMPSDHPSSLKEHQEAVRQLEDLTGQLAKISLPDEQALVQGMMRLIQKYKASFVEFQDHHRMKKLGDIAWRAEWHQASDSLDHLLKEMEGPTEQLLMNSSARAEDSRRQLLVAGIVLLMIGIGMGSIVFYGFARSIARPLVRLQEAAMQIGNGRLDYVIDVQAPGEVGALVEAFQTMAGNVRRHQERFAIVAQATHDVVWDWDLTTNQVWWNEHAYRQFHFAPGDIVLTADWWTAHIHPEDRTNVMESIHRVFDTGGQTWSSEYRFQRGDSTYLTVFDRGFVIYNDAKQPIRMIGAMMDLTERKRLEKAMAQSEKMAGIGQFAAGLAHDVNNPIGVILGFAQTLIGRLGETDSSMAPLKSIEREALRCKTLVQSLLAFSRSQKHQAVVKPEDIRQVVEGALALVTTLARPKQVEVVRTFGENLPLVPIDANQIQQVVINLCVNAMDAMPQGGKLTVGLACKDQAIEISVKDTGTGIAPEIREKIFDAFFTTKEVGKGTGLGLSLISTIVKNHNGKLDLRSDLGKGSTFTIWLPVDAALHTPLAA